MFTETLPEHLEVLKTITADTKLDSSHLSAIGSVIEAYGEKARPVVRESQEAQLVVMEGQDLHIWGMARDEAHIQVGFDCGDNGFVTLTLEQARELQDVLAGLLAAMKRPEAPREPGR